MTMDLTLPVGDIFKDFLDKHNTEESKRERRSTSYNKASDKVNALLDAVDYLDNQITKLEESLASTVASARVKKAAATEKSNALQISYGVSVLVANIFYTASSSVWAKII